MMENGVAAPLDADEQRMIAGMVSPDGDTNFVFDDKASPVEILRSLQIATRAVCILDRKRSGLLQVIGRILYVARHNPAVYRAAGYQSFDKFLKQHVTVTLGLGTTTLRAALTVYESFPKTTPAEVADVGISKMVLLAKMTNHTQPGHQRMIEAAKSQTFSQLLHVAAEKANLPPGDVLHTTIEIRVTKSQGKMWREFCENPQVRAHCQTEAPGLILEYMMEEVMSEWCSEQQAVAPAGEEQPFL
jgi:hypothetical protein